MERYWNQHRQKSIAIFRGANIFKLIKNQYLNLIPTKSIMSNVHFKIILGVI